MADDLEVLEADLGPRIRRSLSAVATLEASLGATAPTAAPDLRRRRRRRRRSRRLVVIGLGGALALSTAAWNTHDEGEVRRIPVEAALTTGSTTDGHSWWLIPSQEIHPALLRGGSSCIAIVELVSGATNRPGVEWSTGGISYGESTGAGIRGCKDETSWLQDPSKVGLGYSRMGPDSDSRSDWGFIGTVHPTIHEVHVSVDGRPAVRVTTTPPPDRPHGPRFLAFTVPPTTNDVAVVLLDTQGRGVTEVTRTLSP